MQTKIETQFTMYSNKLTLVSSVQEDDMLLTEFKCNVPVTLAGDSIWDCDIEAVTITGIYISEADYSGDGDICTSINVAYTVNGDAEYEDSWRLYTDSGFAEAVSELFATDISYTEQGMQEDGLASMEL
jgi:hypothetical protein